MFSHIDRPSRFRPSLPPPCVNLLLSIQSIISLLAVITENVNRAEILDFPLKRVYARLLPLPAHLGQESIWTGLCLDIMVLAQISSMSQLELVASDVQRIPK